MSTENEIGYFGVIVPKHHYWQGFYLNDSFRSQAEDFLLALKKTIGDIYMPPSAVIKELDGVVESDQPWLGAICAGIVDRAVKSDFIRLGAMSMALHILTGVKYFIITADIDSAGSLTKIVNMPYAVGPDDVRRALDADPNVMLSKIFLTQFATENRRKKPN